VFLVFSFTFTFCKMKKKILVLHRTPDVCQSSLAGAARMSQEMVDICQTQGLCAGSSTRPNFGGQKKPETGLSGQKPESARNTKM
jgi:hypothetical protein